MDLLVYYNNYLTNIIFKIIIQAVKYAIKNKKNSPSF